MPLHGRRFSGGSQTTTQPPPLGSGGSGTTGSGGSTIAPGFSGVGSLSIGNAKQLVLISISADKACRVVFYDTLAHAQADSARIKGIKPARGKGIEAEFIFAGGETIVCDPQVVLTNGDTPQQPLIYYSITNLTTAFTTIEFTMDFIQIS